VAASGELAAMPGRETPEEPLDGLIGFFFTLERSDLKGLSSTDRVCGFSFWELEHVDLTKGS
jgi:hypothetical protein